MTPDGSLPRRRLSSPGGGSFGPVRVAGPEREGHRAGKGPGFGQQVRTRFSAALPRRGDESCRPKHRAGPLGPVTPVTAVTSAASSRSGGGSPRSSVLGDTGPCTRRATVVNHREPRALGAREPSPAVPETPRGSPPIGGEQRDEIALSNEGRGTGIWQEKSRRTPLPAAGSRLTRGQALPKGGGAPVPAATIVYFGITYPYVSPIW